MTDSLTGGAPGSSLSVSSESKTDLIVVTPTEPGLVEEVL